MPEDKELIEEIKNGSQAAMEVLVRKHYKTVFAYIYRKSGDYHIAYDLTQEVFIKMMKSLPKYKGDGKFSHWLLKIAVNHCRDYFRSSAFRRKKEEQELVYHVSDEKGNLWDLLSKKLDREKVRAAIHTLPDFQKEPIILKFFHELKIKEIAEITNTNESTVKSRLRQGAAKLKKVLKGGDEDEERKEQSGRT